MKFLLPRDRAQAIRFTAIQSEAGRVLLQRHGYAADGLETLLVLDGSRLHVKTAAIIRVVASLGGLYRMVWLGWLIPAPLRDWGYRHLARNRYRWFGRRDSCLMPDPSQAHRYIETVQQLPSERR